jgi:DMSO/TMAO reductase YedYZ molybdopterin-dependent catalytic subunit
VSREQESIYEAITRRCVLNTIGLLAGRAWALASDEEAVPFADYSSEFRTEAQARDPRVKCFDLRRLNSWKTNNEQFFTFHQSTAPTVDVARWGLMVGGLVERPVRFTLDDLKRLPDRRDIVVMLECAGNSGHPQLMNGLVSNAVWTGVSLAGILRECGVKPEAREIVFLGADTEKEKKWQAGDQEFIAPHGRSIHVQDAVSPEPLLAFGMNGEPLPPEHGFPLRLILPGWYGMSQIKWLTRIEAIDRRYEGRHMARNYHSLRAFQNAEGPLWLDVSISRNRLKAVVARVTRRQAGDSFLHRVYGAAWGGKSRIERVQFRVNGGTWRDARIDHRSDDFGWILWSGDWPDARAGRHTLVARSINANGEIQPTGDELRKGLASNREDNSQWPRSIVIHSR